MGSFVQKLLFKNTYDSASATEDPNDIRNIPIKSIEGESMKLGDLMKGFKLTIVVNVASKWAFAHKSYVELVNVYEEYKPYGM